MAKLPQLIDNSNHSSIIQCFLLPAFFISWQVYKEKNGAELSCITSNMLPTQTPEKLNEPQNIWHSADRAQKLVLHEQQGTSWNAQDICVLGGRLKCFIIKQDKVKYKRCIKFLIKNWFYPSTWIYNMFHRWISYLSIIQTKNVNETNKAFKNGTEAKMYVNTRWLWWKQGKQGKQPLSKCLLLEYWMKQFMHIALVATQLSQHPKIEVSVTIQI